LLKEAGSVIKILLKFNKKKIKPNVLGIILIVIISKQKIFAGGEKYARAV